MIPLNLGCLVQTFPTLIILLRLEGMCSPHQKPYTYDTSCFCTTYQTHQMHFLKSNCMRKVVMGIYMQELVQKWSQEDHL